MFVFLYFCSSFVIYVLFISLYIALARSLVLYVFISLVMYVVRYVCLRYVLISLFM